MVASISSFSSSQISSRLFSALDTKSQGYLEKSDFLSAFSKISSGASGSSASSSSSSSVDDLFGALDSNSDGKVTESEFSSVLSKLQDELQSQFNQSRVHGGGHGGPQGAGGPPPPPPANDAGFTKDELTSQLNEIGSTDSQRSSLISNVVNNFAAADSNGDGKVSFSEAQAYDKSSQTATTTASTSSSSGATTDSSSSTSGTTSNDAGLLFKILQLAHAYGVVGHGQESNSLVGQLSTSA